MRRDGVTLQINLAPTDLPHARWILPHQLRSWAGQVDEVVLTVDLHRSSNRYGHAWPERLPGLRSLVAECRARHPAVRVDEVVYSDTSAHRLGELFFGGLPVPPKDRYGAPFSAYLEGLAAARTRYVFHMDSDMLYGGGSPTWVAEALALLGEREDVLACNPLAGPPALDGRLHSQRLEPEPLPSLAFRAPQLSTRLFLIDMDRLRDRVLPLPLLRPGPVRRLQSRLEGAAPPHECVETILSHAMAARGLHRVDLLGAAPGAWSLHPPHRSPLFYEQLPALVQRVEAGDVPDAQRGRHDVADCMVDWRSARTPRALRWLGHAHLVARHAARERG